MWSWRPRTDPAWALGLVDCACASGWSSGSTGCRWSRRCTIGGTATSAPGRNHVAAVRRRRPRLRLGACGRHRRGLGRDDGADRQPLTWLTEEPACSPEAAATSRGATRNRSTVEAATSRPERAQLAVSAGTQVHRAAARRELPPRACGLTRRCDARPLRRRSVASTPTGRSWSLPGGGRWRCPDARRTSPRGSAVSCVPSTVNGQWGLTGGGQ